MSAAVPVPAPPSRPRPGLRERYLREGPSGFGDGELAGLVLGTGTARHSAAELGQALVQRHGSLGALLRLPPAALVHETGLGAARAVRVHAALELGRRAVLADASHRPRIESPLDAVRLLQPELSGRGVEELHGLYLNRRGLLLHRARLSRGSPTHTILHTGTILRTALLVQSQRLVLAHNHPSGDPRPSPEDLAVTRRIAEAGRLLGVELVDHIVLAGTAWRSLAEEGLLPPSS